MKVFHIGRVSPEGQLKLNNEKRFKEELLSFRGKDITITIEKKSRKRSSQQNRYYHGIVIQAVWDGLRRAGMLHTQDEVHSILKQLFNKKTFPDPATGELTIYGGSTTEMTTTDFMNYIEKIQQWAAENLDTYIPDPQEYIEEDKEEESLITENYG